MTTNEPTPGPTAKGTASSLRMALRIVNTVLDREMSGRAGFNVSRLADEVGIERSKASRTTQDLCDKGFLERRDDSTLRAGGAFFTAAASLHPGLVRRSRPLLRSLAVGHGAGARLSVLDGVQVRVVRAESAAGIAHEWLGPASLVTPCWCTGAGRALLLDHTPDEITALLDDYELIGVGGPDAARSVEELVAANDHDRLRGIVTARGEFEHGVVEYAVPVRDAEGRIRAAVSVVGRDVDLLPRERTIEADLTAAATALADPLPDGGTER
ncbi:IclR family transcriptional regulator C-terminal domain-containing protein [Streptomyces turgidiscabies]|uniref:Transcriptional regulator, IclR family, C-terminal domain protein n=1 Tax=Streptomyces turgidiscabies (strain Car8) TaxID=698760 RepID=L7F6W4_STRT8|nr:MULTISPECIES: IclR family transcriptional regulator C-terminal domain-containing protein [Streptomyces]ELP66776.1 transcriptional regulator, IclR family, C-terminal domain protein [Streptomyces turgidiscabies Car8]MDX3500039.1 IclR family transcriptional regulator C-terminal domain-containing protein [Streptomyces turgidiscabies]